MSTAAFLIAIAALFSFDALLTMWILRRGGRELNPLLAGAMRGLGTAWALIGVKAVAFAVIAWFVAESPGWVRVALVAGYALVCAWNARQVWLTRRTYQR